MEETFSEKHNRLNDEALARIHPIYGRAMLNWSNIEDALCGWFHYLSGMKDAQARAIFFSARSFSGRADMIDALLGVPIGKPIAVDFVRAALKKSLSYNSARNRIAHRIPVINTTNSENHIVELHEGGGYPMLSGDPTMAPHLFTIAENYGKLGKTIRHAWVLTQMSIPPKERKARLQEYLSQVTLLPNEADSSEPSRKQQGRARQQRLSRA